MGVFFAFAKFYGLKEKPKLRTAKTFEMLKPTETGGI
jgi:hypothetical protein